MPGKQKVAYAGLELEVMPIGEERGIYFTDESPKFRLKIHNLTEKKTRGTLTWFYGFGSGSPENITSDFVRFDLDPDGTTEKEIMGKLLGFQGNGVIGIPKPPENMVIESENARERVLKAASSIPEYETLYTFMIMDRDFYHRVYEYPIRIQNQTRVLTIILVILTAIYIAQALGLFKLLPWK